MLIVYAGCIFCADVLDLSYIHVIVIIDTIPFTYDYTCNYTVACSYTEIYIVPI